MQLALGDGLKCVFSYNSHLCLYGKKLLQLLLFLSSLNKCNQNDLLLLHIGCYSLVDCKWQEGE